MLRERTLSDKDVISFLKTFVLVKVDAWGDGKEEAGKFGVRGIPVTMLLDAEGKEIGRKVGFMEPEDYISGLSELRDADLNIEQGKKKIEADATDPAGYLEAAKGYSAKGNSEEAQKNLEKVVELDPKNEKGVAADALEQLADLHANGRRFDKAVETANKLAALDPENTKGLALKSACLLASYYRMLRNVEKYLESSKKIIELDPENKEEKGMQAALEVGQYYAGQGDGENAKKYFEMAKKMDPEDKEGYSDKIDMVLAAMPSAKGEWEKAATNMEEFIKTHEGSDCLPRAHYILGAFNLRAGKKDKCIEAFEKLIKEFPDSSEAKRAERELPQLKK